MYCISFYLVRLDEVFSSLMVITTFDNYINNHWYVYGLLSPEDKIGVELEISSLWATVGGPTRLWHLHEGGPLSLQGCLSPCVIPSTALGTLLMPTLHRRHGGPRQRLPRPGPLSQLPPASGGEAWTAPEGPRWQWETPASLARSGCKRVCWAAADGFAFSLCL